MLRATEFMYDGISSTTYGLKIASLDSNVMEEISYVVPNIIVEKTKKSNVYHYIDIDYESPPVFEFSVISQVPINEEILRNILCWLDARKGFKPLVLLQQGYDTLTYNCIFTVTNLIYHANNIVGLNLSATFDSKYVKGKPIKTTIEVDGEKTINLYNPSDNIDEYIYPLVEFTLSKESNGDIAIVNITDNKERKFEFKKLNIENGSTYIVDNDLKIVQGDTDGLLENFNKKWLRLLKGRNKIKIMTHGVVTITCPKYIKISF